MALGNGFLATGSGFTGGGGSGGGGGIGPPGPQGPAGATGPAGPAGATGPPGPTGAEGPIGPQGPVGPVTEIKGSVPTSGDLPTSGNSIGDAYIVEDTGHLWVWNGASFVDAGLIVGPPGPTGSQGPAGATGPQGPPGTTGATGPVGPAGATGASGATGPQGPVGPTGPAGSVDLTNVLAGQCIAVTSPAAGQVQIDAQTGCIQTPWIQPVNAANNALYNVPVVQFAPQGQIYPSSATGNAMIIWGGAGGTLLRAPVGISTSATFVPAYPLDVQGNVNSSGCYLIGGVAYACSDGAGGVALSNITTINGSAPGGGGNPAPPTQSVQWNDGGAFGGSASLVWDNANARLGVATSTPRAGLEVADTVFVTGDATFATTGVGVEIYASSSGGWVDAWDYGPNVATLLSIEGKPLNLLCAGGAYINLDTFFAISTFIAGTSSYRIYIPAGSANVGIGQNFTTAAYPLDVQGDVNSSGCYRINGNAFACSDGASGINLSNISAINGSAPGGAVTSVFGRTGAVVAQAGDYAVAQVTDAMPNPTSATGDMVYLASVGGITRLPIGTAGQILTVVSGIPAWAAAPSGGFWQAGSGGAIYYNGGNVGVGNTAATLPDANSTNTHFMTGSTTTNVGGEISVCFNGNGAASFNVVNYGITAAEKRVAIVYGGLDGGVSNNGFISFYTMNAGVINAQMTINHVGNVQIPNGPINIGPVVSGMAPGDLSVARVSAPTTGVINFGDAGAYIYFNGSAWSFSPALPSSGGGPTVQSVATASRAMGGTYQNQTGKPLYVNVGLSAGAAAFGYVYCDASSSPSTQVGRFAGLSGVNLYTNIFIIVLPNYYYRVFDQNSATSILDWIEYW